MGRCDRRITLNGWSGTIKSGSGVAGHSAKRPDEPIVRIVIWKPESFQTGR